MNILAIEPKIITSLEVQKDQYNADFEFNVEFFNYSGHVITVATRSGVKFKIRNVQRFGYKDVIIRTTYTVRCDAKNNCIDILNAVQNKSRELALFDEAFQYEVSINPPRVGFLDRGWSTINVSMEYHIPIKDVINSDGRAIYNRDMDVVICCGNENECPDHPHSAQHIVNGNALNVKLDNTRGITYSQYLLIDNEGELGNRYVNLNGDVMCIKPSQDPDLVSGIYVTTSNRIEEAALGITKSQTLQTRVIPPKDFHDNGIYATFEDASTLGDGNARLKESLLKRDHELAMLKKEMEQEKLSLDKRARELDAQSKEIEHRRSLEKIRIADLYEDRSYYRKDSSESFKMIPIIIGAVTALVGIIVGLFPRK